MDFVESSRGRFGFVVVVIVVVIKVRVLVLFFVGVFWLCGGDLGSIKLLFVVVFLLCVEVFGVGVRFVVNVASFLCRFRVFKIVFIVSCWFFVFVLLCVSFLVVVLVFDVVMMRLCCLLLFLFVGVDVKIVVFRRRAFFASNELFFMFDSKKCSFEFFVDCMILLLFKNFSIDLIKLLIFVVVNLFRMCENATLSNVSFWFLGLNFLVLLKYFFCDVLRSKFVIVVMFFLNFFFVVVYVIWM